MTDKYKIFSIDNSRDHYVTDIYRKLTPKMYQCGTKIVNGYHKPSLDVAIEDLKLDIKPESEQLDPPLRTGHIGVWCSFLYALQDAPVITFDDDAILNPRFVSLWNLQKLLLPRDADFFALFIPRDSDHMWDASMLVNKVTSRVYARYGGVSFYYTERGKENINALVKEEGIIDQYDNTLYRWAKQGKLNGYCRPPTEPDLVYITGQEQSIVQESPVYGRV